jgi:hypothetical protein
MHNGVDEAAAVDIDEEPSTIEEAVQRLYECNESVLRATLAQKGIPLGDDCTRIDMIVRLAALTV